MFYDFVNENGESIEREYPIGKAPGFIVVDGCRYERDILGAVMSCNTAVKNWNGVGRNPCSTWPRSSTAMGIAAEDVPSAMAHDRKHGVPTEYTREGDPILTSKGHEKRYMDLHGFAHRGSVGKRRKRNE